MGGAVTADTIPSWVRVSGSFPVLVEYGTNAGLDNARRTEPVTASKEADYTVVLNLTDLDPETTYHYRVHVNGRPSPHSGVFTAQTAPAGPAAFRVSFGSCARVQADPHQPIWNGVAAIEPDLFFWVGDNIYGDALDPDILAEEYRRQFTVPALRPVLATVAQLAVWDDHDFGLNDHDRTHPAKEEALEVFKRYWANPAYGLPETPGVFFTYSYGGVDFFFLDCRYHRDPNAQPDGPDKTLLGAGQLAWLKEALNASEAPFKVLISGSGFNSAKGMGGDSWASYIHERDALFNYIRDEGISGVVLLSGDTHTGEFNAIPWSDHGGYDFYELVSSPLAQGASRGWRNRSPELRVRTPYEDVNAGWLEFDMTANPPTLTLNLIDAEGKAVWDPVTITAADLVNGQATARSKAQPVTIPQD